MEEPLADVMVVVSALGVGTGNELACTLETVEPTLAVTISLPRISSPVSGGVAVAGGDKVNWPLASEGDGGGEIDCEETVLEIGVLDSLFLVLLVLVAAAGASVGIGVL